MTRIISNRSIVMIAAEQESADLGGEAAILNLNSGVYYGLDPVGARIWNLIRRPRSVQEVKDTLVAEYDVDPERCERDLLKLLGDLLNEGLVEVRGEAAEKAPASPAG